MFEWGVTIDVLFRWMAHSSVQASLLVILVLGVQWALRGRLSAGWRYGFWLLVLGRLVLAVGPSSQVSIYNLARAPATAETAKDAPHPEPAVSHGGNVHPLVAAAITTWRVVSEYLPQDRAELLRKWRQRGVRPTEPLTASPARGDQPVAPASITPPPPRTAREWISLLVPLAWVVGAAALLLRLGIAWLMLTLRSRRWRLCRDAAVLDLVAECKQAMGVRRSVRIAWAAERTSPAVTGVFRPTLLLPADFVSTLSADEQRFVLMHELGHLRRQDVLFHWLGSVAVALHWFNPMIWLAAARARADRELACDALVLDRVGQGRNAEYGLTIVKLLERVTCRGFLPGAVGISENKRQIKRRIRMIASFKLGTWKTRLVGAVAMIAMCVVGLTDSRAQVAPVEPAKPAAADVAPVKEAPAGVSALDALAQVRSDAAVVVVVPNWQKLDQKVTEYAKLFGVNDFHGLTKTFGDMNWDISQFDPNGAVAMVLESIDIDKGPEKAVYLLIPVKDYAAFCKAN
ncbi:MAG: M56 family metallopeptidase, partial [Phycisphaerae bacterium]|nr:M56 family metallopeptidase [Phycisphaerae bacterium]